MKKQTTTNTQASTEARRARLRKELVRNTHINQAMMTLFLAAPLAVAEEALASMVVKCPSCGKDFTLTVEDSDPASTEVPPFLDTDDTEARKEARAHIDGKLGVERRPAIRREGCRLTLGVMTPSEARAEIERREKASKGRRS